MFNNEKIKPPVLPVDGFVIITNHEAKHYATIKVRVGSIVVERRLTQEQLNPIVQEIDRLAAQITKETKEEIANV